MANGDSTSTDIKNLESFLNELEDILGDIKKSDVLAKTATKYEQNLTKLISTTKGIIDNTATQEQAKNFEKLLNKTDMSLKVVRKKNKDDEAFQTEFKQVFGDVRDNQEVSESILRKMSSSVLALTKSVNVISASSREDVKDTALSFFTGPFGKIIESSVDLGGIKEAVTSRFGGKSSPSEGSFIDGQAHDGMTNIPREGKYNLDGGERIVKKNQNQDLTKFLKSGGGGFDDTILSTIEKNTRKTDAIKVFNEDHDSGYFDSIIDNDDRIANEKDNTERSHFKSLMEKFEILSDIINRSNLTFITSMFVQFDLWSKRFMRHPVLNTLALLLKPLSIAFGKVWTTLFGQKKTETELIVESNDNIVKAIRKQKIESKEGTAFTRFFRNLNQFGDVVKAQQAEKKRSEGGTLTKKEQASLDRQEKFITLLPNAIKKEESSTSSLFVKKDATQETLTEKLVGFAARSLFISEEMLESIKEKGKGAGRGIMSGIMGIFGAMGAKLGPLLMKAAPMFLTRLLPAGAALFAGFKLGEWLNVKFGEWLDLDMDLGNFIGMKVFDFVESITSVFDDLTRSIEQNGLFDTMASIATGGGIPKTETKDEAHITKLREQRSADQAKAKGSSVAGIMAREKAGEITKAEMAKLISEAVATDTSKISQQSVTSRVVVPQNGGQNANTVNNSNVTNNNISQVKERLRPHIESAAVALGIN